MNSILIGQTRAVLNQLSEAINLLEHAEYKKPLDILSGSTLGQHVRHVIEFYQCMLKGYETGVINYDLRVRDKMIEESREFALQCIHKIMYDLTIVAQSKTIILEVAYEETTALPTTFERELVYNIEHAIHHMALLKIGIKEVNAALTLPAEFGVAASTIRHQQHVHRNLSA
ncbi:MAG TPA: hypothetical protein VNB90_06740 [Cytophagaceae bacterium]|jgi:hypothetical protein|nr:hypothetical protein [Cytophagaceae bacterium]